MKFNSCRGKRKKNDLNKRDNKRNTESVFLKAHLIFKHQVGDFKGKAGTAPYIRGLRYRTERSDTTKGLSQVLRSLRVTSRGETGQK